MGDKALFSNISTKVNLFWESFLKADINSYERGAWLDLFLAESLSQIRDGTSPAEIISLTSCTVTGLLASEVVSDIQSICSQSGDGEDLAPLRSHLLSGRGWRSLALLHALGVQDVTCNGELTRNLTCIYNFVDGKDVKTKNPYVIEKSLPEIEQVCRFRVPSRLKTRTFSHSSGVEGSPPSRKISTASSIHSKRASFGRQDQMRYTSESEAVDNDTHKSSLKIRLDPMDFDYFTSVVRSEDELRKNCMSYQPGVVKKKPKKLTPDNFRDERLHKVFREEISCLQFRCLIVELLRGLCQSELASAQVCVQSFSFSLEQLCTLQFSSAVMSESQQNTNLKFAITSLFLSALDKILLQPESMNQIVQKGALPMMLRLLEDGIIKSQCNKDDCTLSQDFIFGVMYAVINFIHCLLLQQSAPEKPNAFLTHFQLFVNSFNGRIVDKTVLAMIKSRNIEEKVILNRVNKIIGLLSQLILSFKQIRTKVVHLRHCKKQRHKNCHFPDVSHHHDNVFGKVYTNTLLPSSTINEESCAITCLFMIFTRFLSEKIQREVTIRTMKAMMICGTCCCFPASKLISRILKVIQQADTRVRNLGLVLLEKTIYREVGAIDVVGVCQVCLKVEEKDSSLLELTKHRWACLEAFQDMLLSPNYKVAYTIGSHLMRVTPQCSVQVQREMFFGVFYPVFITTKKRYLTSNTEKDKFTIVMCLSAFTNLLNRMRFAEEFFERNGVVHVLDLIKDKNFTHLCCLIMEIVIIIHVWKAEKKDLNDIVEMNISGLKVLQEFVDEATTQFLTLLKRLEKYTDEENNEIILQNDKEWDTYMKALEKLTLFWKSWMSLCLYCPHIRGYFNRHLSIQCYSLFSIFLHHLSRNVKVKDMVCNTAFSDKLFSMNQLNLKLLESLIILSVVSPYSGNPEGVFGLRNRLEKVVVGSLGLRSVCDVLIRSSGAKASKKTLIPTHPMPKLDNIEFILVNPLEEGNSDSSFENSADEGYDADVDVPCRKIQEKDSSSLKGSLPPSRRISSILGERRLCQITHPELCHLTLHLIVHCSSEEKWLKDSIYSLHKISSILRDNPENVLYLANSGFTLSLLTQFSELLSENSSTLYELQQAVLEVFCYLAKYSIQSRELAIFMSSFISEKPPLKMLLPCFSKLLMNTTLQPKFILSFPREYSNSNLVVTSQAHKLGISLHQQHLSLGVSSCWARAAILLPINAELGWAMWVQGFSLSLWLRIEQSPSLEAPHQSDYYADSTSSESGRSSGLDEINVDHLLHIVSIGYEALVLEFWADGTRELLHIRLTRPDGPKLEVLSEASLEGRLPPSSWHHLAVSVHDSVHSGRVVIEVTLIIDGWCEVQVPLAFKGLLVRKSRPTLVLVGDTNTKGCGKWELGGLMMFRRPVLDKGASMYLSAVGPDVATMTRARVGNPRPLWPTVFTARALSPGIPWGDLLASDGSGIKELQESMLLTYSAKNPDAIHVYPLASVTSGLSAGFRVVSVEQRSSQLVPMQVGVVRLCSSSHIKHSSIGTAVDSLGGVTVFLFLFARVVEAGGGEIEQAQALELFLRLGRTDPHLKAQSELYLPLVSTVLESPLTLVGPHMLKAVMDTVCDRAGLLTSWADEVTLASKDDFLLTQPHRLVSLTLGSPTCWPPPTLLLLLRALLSLLRDDHPHREFNSAQLNRARALDAILYFCKERLVEERDPLDSGLCSALVEVTRGLMTAPPQLSHMAAISDYLLLAHPAHATYISHSRSSLYFVLPPRPAPPSGSRRNRVQRNFNLFGGIVDVKSEYRGLFTQPVDATKLNKALYNLQIKQRGVNSPRESFDGTDVICDSGIAGSCREFTAGSTNTQEFDQLSNTSANTYFLTRKSADPEDTSGESSSNATEDDAKYIHENVGGEGESRDGTEIGVVTGLLELLRDQILVTPDSVAHSALPNVISPESFIVMANHSSPPVVTAVVRVLSAYLERANAEEKARFIKDRGFYLLAMQLNHVIPTAELADALAGIVTMSHCLPLSLQVEASCVDLNLPGLPPLLSLLPRSVSDIPLAHNIIAFLHNIFLKIPDWRTLLEYGLIEVLLKTLVAVMHRDDNTLTDLCVPEHHVLLSDINSFLSSIVIHSIQTTGSNNMQVLGEVILQLEYCHGLEVTTGCSPSAACCEALKLAQCCLLRSAIKGITEAINAHTSRPSFFSSVISLSSDDMDHQPSSSSSSLNTLGKLSKNDLIERFKFVICRATEFVVYTEPVNENEVVLSSQMLKVVDFVREVWNYLLQSLVTVIERKSLSTKTTWSNVVYANRDILRALGAQMFLWLLSPKHSRNLKMFTIYSILNEPRSKDVLTFIISSTQLEKTLAHYLWELRFGDSCDPRDRHALDEFGAKLEEWCNGYVLGVVTGETEAREAAVEAAAEAALARESWRSQHLSQIHKVVYRYEGLVKEVAERAMGVTKEVEASQSHQRKLLMESIKNGFGTKVQAAFKWREVVSSLSHEGAVWHFSQAYPSSWELDPTEGPARVRNRLRRCHLDLDNKYFRNSSSRVPVKKEVLSFIFEGAMSTSAVLIDRLHTNAKIRHMCKASVITPDREDPGELLIGGCSLYFVPSSGDNTKEWLFDQIKELHRRRFELQERALEIFLLNGKTFFMAFETTKERDGFMGALLDCELCNRVASEPLVDAVDLWREGHLTNWQYLGVLNTLSGRSYNDLMQYPVLPFILADYTSQVLDLEDPISYRNLMKPMAIQEKKNEQHYINNYNYLKTDATNEISYNQEPYHYCSHYSNSGVVLHFLVRLPPFTKMFLSYQDKNFDWPDRTFHSLHTTWRLTSSESATDVKEMIPEFFTLPEFLCNSESFDFGTRQNGEPVNDVILPPWALNPRLFILIHRQALESDHVREYLPHWIDLVFGYKQVGKAAVESINVFHPATYYGFDPESITDPLLREAWQTMVRMYGQMPKQLFRAPHPIVVQSMEPKKTVPQVIPNVKGLSWGHYVGSPGDGPPSVIWQGIHNTPISTLVALASNDVFGLAPSTALLLSYNKESTLAGSTTLSGTSVLGAALISWGHGDGVIRAKLKKEQVPFPAIADVSGDTIALCTSVPDSGQLWIAYLSGKILVYTYKFDGCGSGLEVSEEPAVLTGHLSPITGLALSRGFSLAVSVSEDGAGHLWDMNTLYFIRSLPQPESNHYQINLVSISETLGDVATGGDCPDGQGSWLRLYSVNASPVGMAFSRERITSLTFSPAPEGKSVNVIAAGLIDGSVGLWSTWDLTFVKKITAHGIIQPIISLTYSQDAQHLYASTSQGQVVVWQGSNLKLTSKMPRFLNLTSLL